MREEIQPGTSALFVMSSNAVIDRVKEAFEGQPMVLVETNLSHDEEQKMRDVFAESDDLGPATSMPGPRAAEPSQTAQPTS
jgi:uncharacterized membrane protein